jgi:hypothetical protein
MLVLVDPKDTRAARNKDMILDNRRDRNDT